MTRRALVRSWYALLAAVVLLAVVGQLVIVAQDHRSVPNFFSYFTVESNLLVLVTSLWWVAEPEPAGGWLRQSLRLAALTGILVTGVVYGSLIAPFTHPQGVEWLYDVLFHYVSPAMAVIGFVAVDPRGRLRPRHLVFLGWPVAWAFYTMLRGTLGVPRFGREDGSFSNYPYGFLDTDAHGWGVVSIYLLAITVLLMLLAAAYIVLDRRLVALAGQDAA